MSACLFLCAILQRVTLNLNRVLPISREQEHHMWIWPAASSSSGRERPRALLAFSPECGFPKATASTTRASLRRWCGSVFFASYFRLLSSQPPPNHLRGSWWCLGGADVRNCAARPLTSCSRFLAHFGFLSKVVTFFRLTPGFVV